MVERAIAVSLAIHLAGAAKSRCDAENTPRDPRGTAFHPLEFAAERTAEAARPCSTVWYIGYLFHCCRAALGHPTVPDCRLHSIVHDSDVRDRSTHRDLAIRPVLHPARACHPGDRERIPLRGSYPDPVDPDVSRGVWVDEPDWRYAEYGVALRLLARWLSHVRNRLCLA